MSDRRVRRAPFPEDYLAVASERDRWFRLGIGGVLASMLVTAASYAYRPLLVALLATGGFVIFAAVRFAVLDQKSGRLLEPWLEANPYRGPGQRIVGPLRRFAIAHPLLVGLGISLFLFALLVGGLIARHRFAT